MWEGDETEGGRPGQWREYEGGYEDWRVQSERARTLREAAAPKPSPAPNEAASTPAPTAQAEPAKARTKLSYKEQRELDAPTTPVPWRPIPASRPLKRN